MSRRPICANPGYKGRHLWRSCRSRSLWCRFRCKKSFQYHLWRSCQAGSQPPSSAPQANQHTSANPSNFMSCPLLFVKLGRLSCRLQASNACNCEKARRSRQCRVLVFSGKIASVQIQVPPQLKLHISVSVGSSDAIAVRERHAMPPKTAIGTVDQTLIASKKRRINNLMKIIKLEWTVNSGPARPPVRPSIRAITFEFNAKVGRRYCRFVRRPRWQESNAAVTPPRSRVGY